MLEISLSIIKKTKINNNKNINNNLNNKLTLKFLSNTKEDKDFKNINKYNNNKKD